MNRYDKVVEICAKNLICAECLPQQKKGFLQSNEDAKKNWGITDEEISKVKATLDIPTVLQSSKGVNP